MSTFADLVKSRRDWIDSTLKPWCRQATLAELKRAEMEWSDIAGKIDPRSTLWTWAWSRFPDLVHESLAGVDETHEVRVTLKSGESICGYPNNRKTSGGELSLLAANPDDNRQFQEFGPFSIDRIAAVDRITQ